jgi:(1->4)-alpha-D-glucan 1-alpha-D-glucosylmutase
MQIPISTYRIQFHKDFGFSKARNISEYLARLGIGAVYASPIFKAAPGSTHGYDVADPNQVNPEVGSEEELNALFTELRRYNLGWIQDIVPNHMVFSSENKLLMDVLEKGYYSPYSRHFDISWSHPNQSLRRRLLVPVLGAPYYEILKNKELKLVYEAGTWTAQYYQAVIPLKIESYPMLFESFGAEDAQEGPAQAQTAAQTSRQRFVDLFAAMVGTPVEDRAAAMENIKQALWQSYTEDTAFKAHVDAQVEAINADLERVHEILLEQHFRLAYWRTASKEINYRRFFNINELISVRVEDPDVFNHTHQLIFKLLKRAVVGGVRVDHIDGLNDPFQYLQQLRTKAGEDAYLVVEKILEPGEKLPATWPIQGTSGYDFLTHLNSVFCYHANKDSFQTLYSGFTGQGGDFKQLLFDKKKLILEKLLAGDLEKLVFSIRKIAQYLPEGADLLQSDLRQTVTALLCSFPVYRTYISTTEEVTPQDREYIEEAIAKTAELLPKQELTLQFLRKLLVLEFPKYINTPKKRSWIKTVMKFQQVTGPLMAKGLEDTTFYIFNRLLSINEVGGDPEAFGITLEDFHQFNEEQMQAWPHKMNASATHDTKRGEHVRARINVLSEIPDEWIRQVEMWHEVNKSVKQSVDDALFPDKNEEYFLYQILLGTWPFADALPDDYAGRIEEYMLKAVREAKVHTDWVAPNDAFEEALLGFIRKLLDPSHSFQKVFLPFKNRVAQYGIYNALSQTLLKLTSPGVPDVYQGTELWDFSLVDPDNRRPVDYTLRMEYLGQIQTLAEQDCLTCVRELLANKEDGRIKLFTIYKSLQFRKANAELFQQGEYIPLSVGGTYAANIIAFARRHAGKAALVVVPRFLTQVVQNGDLPLGEAAWQDTYIEVADLGFGNWQHIFTNEKITSTGQFRLGDVFREFPLGLLKSE